MQLIYSEISERRGQGARLRARIKANARLEHARYFVLNHFHRFFMVCCHAEEPLCIDGLLVSHCLLLVVCYGQDELLVARNGLKLEIIVALSRHHEATAPQGSGIVNAAEVAATIRVGHLK